LNYYSKYASSGGRLNFTRKLKSTQKLDKV